MTKWLLIAVAVLVLWYGYRWYERTKTIAAEKRDRVRRDGPAGAPATSHDMRKCGVCGVFVAADSAPCGRPNCPQGRRA